MAYTNSSLVSYTKLSPHHSGLRNHTIDTITIHCMAGNLSVETCGNIFMNAKASSNYGIGSDGRIALYVEEKNRSWCTSSSSNDNRAVTIEVANDGGAPDWHVSNKAMDSLIKLCADICKRNNIKELKWEGNKNLIGQINRQNMTVHRWFAAKACPGDYLYNKHSYIVKKVNKILGSKYVPSAPKSPQPVISTNSTKFKEGDIIKLKANATYYNGVKIPSFIFKSTLYYRGKNNNGIIISTKKTGAITGIVKESAIETKNTVSSTTANSSYKVKVTSNDLNIRRGPGTKYSITGRITDCGIYTIVEISNNWGRLRSGLGWICLDYTKKV